MRRWIREHVLAVKDALGRLVRHSPATVLNVLVMGFALALPAGLHAVLKNVSELLPRAAPEPQLTLFLRTSAASGEIEAISARLQAHAAVARARFVSKDKALDDLKQSAGLVDVVDELGRNPLPDAFIVSARKDAAAEEDKPAGKEAPPAKENAPAPPPAKKGASAKATAGSGRGIRVTQVDCLDLPQQFG